MALGLIVKTGRILTAKLLLGQAVDGITHCAIGDGDASFTDPQNPPAPDIGQTGLRNERARKRYYKRTFLKEDAEGALLVNGVRYLETGEETNTIGVFFRFDEAEARAARLDNVKQLQSDADWQMLRTSIRQRQALRPFEQALQAREQGDMAKALRHAKSSVRLAPQALAPRLGYSLQPLIEALRPAT